VCVARGCTSAIMGLTVHDKDVKQCQAESCAAMDGPRINDMSAGMDVRGLVKTLLVPWQPYVRGNDTGTPSLALPG
jgi:hypothetical protein